MGPPINIPRMNMVITVAAADVSHPVIDASSEAANRHVANTPGREFTLSVSLPERNDPVTRPASYAIAMRAAVDVGTL
eukprot:1106804-Amorphochlora_amoeboformis.AAC.1